MGEVAAFPIVGGPADGRSATVEVDEDGNPPAELQPGDIDVYGDGLYVRQPIAGSGPPWTYQWREAAS